MNANTSSLTEGCIRELYTLNRTQAKQPTLQVVGFEESEANEKQIIIRVSDGICFVDCTLSGNYQILNGVICEIKNTTTVTHFRQFHVVRLVDYFSKLDENKICKLKIIIRKMSEVSAGNDLIGCPQQIQQYMLNNRKILPRQDNGKRGQTKDMEHGYGRSEQSSIKIENVMDVQNNYNFYSQNNQVPHQPYSQHSAANTPTVKTMKRQAPNSNNDNSGLGEPLTLAEIMSGKDGFIIGKLVRYKHARKETKDGPMTVCYLGLLDKNYELIRIHLAGRLAMNNEKLLKQNKAYYIKGFDLVPVKNAGVQIRLKDKEYKILEIHNEDYTRNLSSEYFHWDHESETENEFVDVIGLVDDIEQKTNYNPNSQSDKSVIRVVLRNKYKSIRISFWTDQMKNLESFNLKRKEWIIIEDVRKKQSKYYDFAFQSRLIRVSDDPMLVERFRDVFPDIVEDREPKSIKDLSKFYEKDPNNSKLRNITAYFTHLYQNKIVYRLCDQCKKKVEKNATQCQECGSQNLVYKYNCPLQFSDSTGSIVCVLFDVVANKLIGKTANEVSQLNEQELNEVFQPLYYRPYLLTIQFRNQRFIMKSIQALYQAQEANLAKQNLGEISQIMLGDEYWSLLKA